MARYPDAKWRALPENRTEPKITPTCVVLHTAVSNAQDLYEFFARPSVVVESHFYVPASGSYPVMQYIDTGTQADAQFDGNAYAISIESWDRGQPAEVAWSSWQREQLARICAWAHEVHGIPLVKAYKDGNVIRGIGYHAQFHVWNKTNHSCPGPLRIPQVGGIIRRAKEIVANGTLGSGGGSGAVIDVKSLQHLLNRWYDAGVVEDGIWGPNTEGAVKDVQRFLHNHYDAGLAVDGVWGDNTRQAHKERLVSIESKLDRIIANTEAKAGPGLAKVVAGIKEGETYGVDQLAYKTLFQSTSARQEQLGKSDVNALVDAALAKLPTESNLTAEQVAAALWNEIKGASA